MRTQRVMGNTKEKSVGTLHPEDTLFLKMKGGDIHNQKTNELLYYVDANVAGMNPIVTSVKTHRVFTLSWQEIIKMAITAGIDKEK